MSDDTKIVLSAPELIMARDTEWILTKQRITEKVFHLFNLQVREIKTVFNSCAELNDPLILGAVPRIFKGENYRQLPYVMLDYPAVFKGEDIFAVRTMFWWGNFFSIVLLVSGGFLENYRTTIITKLQNNAADFFICIGDGPWEHHFEADNFVPATSLDLGRFASPDFIKIGLRYDLKHWNSMPQLLNEGYKAISNLIESSFRDDEKGL